LAWKAIFYVSLLWIGEEENVASVFHCALVEGNFLQAPAPPAVELAAFGSGS
jgi:hypothetical protein